MYQNSPVRMGSIFNNISRDKKLFREMPEKTIAYPENTYTYTENRASTGSIVISGLLQSYLLNDVDKILTQLKHSTDAYFILGDKRYRLYQVDGSIEGGTYNITDPGKEKRYLEFNVDMEYNPEFQEHIRSTSTIKTNLMLLINVMTEKGFRSIVFSCLVLDNFKKTFKVGRKGEHIESYSVCSFGYNNEWLRDCPHISTLPMVNMSIYVYGINSSCENHVQSVIKLLTLSNNNLHQEPGEVFGQKQFKTEYSLETLANKLSSSIYNSNFIGTIRLILGYEGSSKPLIKKTYMSNLNTKNYYPSSSVLLYKPQRI